jgi:hypothetical protein
MLRTTKVYGYWEQNMVVELKAQCSVAFNTMLLSLNLDCGP